MQQARGFKTNTRRHETPELALQCLAVNGFVMGRTESDWNDRLCIGKSVHMDYFVFPHMEKTKKGGGCVVQKGQRHAVMLVLLLVCAGISFPKVSPINLQRCVKGSGSRFNGGAC